MLQITCNLFCFCLTLLLRRFVPKSQFTNFCERLIHTLDHYAALAEWEISQENPMFGRCDAAAHSVKIDRGQNSTVRAVNIVTHGVDYSVNCRYINCTFLELCK